MTDRWIANHRRQRAFRILRQYPHRGTLLIKAGGRVTEISADRARAAGYQPRVRKPRYAHRRAVSAETIEELMS